MKDGEKSGQLSYEQVAALKDVKDMTGYLNVAQRIADLEGRTTRCAYAKLTSKESGGDFDRPVDLPSEDQVRKSSRARSAIYYSGLSDHEDNTREITTPKQTEEINKPHAQITKQSSFSTSASSTSNRSTSMPVVERHARDVCASIPL